MNEFTTDIFNKYRNFIFEMSGINYEESKRTLLEIKIRKAMRKRGYDSLEDYFLEVTKKSNEQLYQEFINVLTTNTSEFFRESEHFHFIHKNIATILKNNPSIEKNKEIRVWCAASSKGQEPITIAITLKECLEKDINIKILATDIDSNVLLKAINGIYSPKESISIPDKYLKKYFEYLGDEGFKVKSSIHDLIKYRKFNLMNDFKFKKSFDIIFCRNVMIYFNEATQVELIKKFYEKLAFGGYFFSGHTESLISKKNKLKSIEPSVYYKDR